MRIAVVSDTHLPRGARRLPDECWERLAAADLIIHAGDFLEVAVLDELESLGTPVVGVQGNVDSPELRERLPVERVVEADGVAIGIVHDAGPAGGRLERMRVRFPGTAAVVFGHSHIPLQEESKAFQIFNPGSPTDRRRQPRHTMGEAIAEAGRVRFDLIDLG